MKNNLIGVGSLLASVIVGLSADTASTLNTSASCNCDSSFDSAFQKGNWEFGINSGVMFSPFIVNVQKHIVNYTTSGLQAGYMLSTPGISGWYRGNFELLGELFGGAVIQGKGDYIAGGTFWLRYNFVLSGWRIKPYAQFGIGGESTDIDRRILGQDFNFNLDASLGLRCMVTPRCSVNMEWRYQHLSDSGMSKVNRGINAHGAVLGVSWLF